MAILERLFKKSPKQQVIIPVLTEQELALENRLVAHTHFVFRQANRLNKVAFGCRYGIHHAVIEGMQGEYALTVRLELENDKRVYFVDNKRFTDKEQAMDYFFTTAWQILNSFA